MIDQIFPQIFPSEKPEVGLSTWDLFKYISLFPIVFLIRGISGYFNSYFINYCGIRVLEKIRFEVFAKLQRLPVSFFHRNQEGDLLSRMISDTGQLQSAILQVSWNLTPCQCSS